MTTKPSDFEKVVTEELQKYADTIGEGLKEDINSVTKSCMKELRRLAPKGKTGRYSKSFKRAKLKETATGVEFVIYSSEYQRAHLLEKSHKTKNGGMTKAYPHFAPALENAERQLEKKTIARVKRT